MIGFYDCLTTLTELIIGNNILHQKEHKNSFIETKAPAHAHPMEYWIDLLIYSSHCLTSGKNWGLFSYVFISPPPPNVSGMCKVSFYTAREIYRQPTRRVHPESIYNTNYYSPSTPDFCISSRLTLTESLHTRNEVLCPSSTGHSSLFFCLDSVL